MSSSLSSAPGCCRATPGTRILEPRRKAKVRTNCDAEWIISILHPWANLPRCDKSPDTRTLKRWRLSLIQLCFNKWQIGFLQPLLVSLAQWSQISHYDTLRNSAEEPDHVRRTRPEGDRKEHPGRLEDKFSRWLWSLNVLPEYFQHNFSFNSHCRMTSNL